MFVDLENELHMLLSAKMSNDSGHVEVLTAAELADVTTDRQPTPAVHLFYQGYKVIELRPDGKAARVDQSWLVIVACKNVSSWRSGQAARNEAGERAEQVVDALMGYRLPSAAGPIRLANAPKPAYIDGITYFPLSFDIATTLKSGEA